MSECRWAKIHKSTYCFVIEASKSVKDFSHNRGPCNDVFALSFGPESVVVLDDTQAQANKSISVHSNVTR